MLQSVIDDITLASAGEAKMPWFRAQMPILSQLNTEFNMQKPFSGLVIAACFHLEPKTAYWMESMLAGGAEHIYLVGNLGTTKPDTAAFLAAQNRITVLGKAGDTLDDHKNYLARVMTEKIDLFLDNGASLILAYHKHRPAWRPLGANEETRSGKLLIEKAGFTPAFPVIVIDDSPVKWKLENAIGVGQSVVDGFMRATSLLIGGKNVLIIGYGHCGTGVAGKFRAMGANTMVYDIDPVVLLKARADGNRVGGLDELLPQADVVITVTGRFDVITADHLPLLRRGVILANAGHYGFEIDRQGLRQKASAVSNIRPGIEEFVFGDKTVYLLENASPLNLSAADGNPIEIMDIGLGLQASCARRLALEAHRLPSGLQTVPQDINDTISRISLSAQKGSPFSIKLDKCP
jgi:adenosylhomocysteinase